MDLLRRSAPVILLFVLAVVFLLPALLPGRALLPAAYLNGMLPWNAGQASDQQPQWNPLLWDGIAQFYPWRVHFSRSVGQGGYIPLWNPHQFCGTPFVANAQTAVFYPLNLLFVAFNPARAFGVLAMIHLFLAGAFTFLLARALGVGRFGATISGVTFAFSAFMVLWIELPTLVNAATWLPLVLYLILRAWDRTGPFHAIFAGFALGVAILAGHLQIASYVIMAAALWLAWLTVSRARVDGWDAVKKGLLVGGVTFGVALLISAPQILPTIELARLSHRVREVNAEGYASYLAGAIPARHLIALFVPNFYGNPATASYIGGSAANYMEYGMYIGILPLLLAIFGAVFTIRWRAAGFFLTLVLLSFLLAVGTPLNAIIYYLVPGTSSLGGPNRTIVLFCFGAAMLAGFGGHWFAQLAQEEYRATRRKLGWRALSVGGAIFATILIAAQSITSASLDSLGVNSAQVAAAAIGAYTFLGTMLIVSLGVLALYTAGQLPKPFFAFLCIVVTAADLFAFGMGFNPTSSLDEVYPRTALTDWLSRNVGQTRLMPINRTWSLSQTPEAVLPPNSATVYGFYDMQGYDSLFPKLYKEFVDGHLGMDSSPQENGNMLLIRDYVPDWPEGTAGFVLSSREVIDPNVKRVAEADGVRVYRRNANTPYQPTYLLPPTEGPSYRSWITERRANRVAVVAETDRPARVVLADTYYPGWKAYVEGQERPVEMAQGVFRSVTVEPGTQAVVFRYEPASYIVGLFLGLLGLAPVGAALGMITVRRRI